MTALKSFSQTLFALALLSATTHYAQADDCTDSVCGTICDKVPGYLAKKGYNLACPGIRSAIISACKSDDPCTAICDSFPTGKDTCKTACGKVGNEKIKDACKKCPASTVPASPSFPIEGDEQVPSLSE